MLVVLGHAILFSFPELIARKDFFYIQSWAVVVFLALSGYLIARSVLRRVENGTFTLSGYIKDRGARILTPLIPLIRSSYSGIVCFSASRRRRHTFSMSMMGGERFSATSCCCKITGSCRSSTESSTLISPVDRSVLLPPGGQSPLNGGSISLSDACWRYSPA